MPMPNYQIQGTPQLQQQQGPLGALGDFAKSKALSVGLEAAFPGSGLAKEAGQAVLPALLQEGGEAKKVPWWKSNPNRQKVEAATKKKPSKVSKGDIGSVIGSLLSAGFFQGGGGVPQPRYQRMQGMTPGPLGMSDMLAAGKGKDVSKVIYKKKGGEIEDVVEIAYHAPLAAKPKGE